MKRVIITGASNGLGLELAKSFIKKGFEVVGLSRTAPKDVKIKHIKVDLTNNEDIDNAVSEIKNKYSNFKYLINCAGILNIRKTNDLKIDEIERLFKINVFAPMILSSELMDIIIKNESDIVNVGSSSAFKAIEGQSVYSSSKWAIRGFTKNLQLELKKTKSRAINFNPAGFKSGLFERSTGGKQDLSSYMDVEDVASLLITTLELPKNMEVSEILINRK
jgi:short-subunit dehydrogenase